MLYRIILTLVLFLLTPGAHGQDSAAVADRIAAQVDQRNSAALALLEESVNINSGTLNVAGVREVGELFRVEFEARGFETEWIDGTPFERAGHLIARRAGHKDAPHVLLIGHLDTVFEPDSPFQRYEPLEGNRARGPGTTDMKGGNVIMLFALEALLRLELLDGLTVTAFLVGDEERAGTPLDAARADLRAAGREADVALGFEDGDGNPRTAVASRRGASGWRLEVQGRPAHSSQVFQPTVGFGAIYEAARILDRFRQELSAWENLTFNPGAIVGGTEATLDSATSRGSAFGKNNIVAEHAVVTGDLRATSRDQLTRAREAMRRIVAASLTHTQAEITFTNGYPPLAQTKENLELLAVYSKASEDLGFGPVAPVDPRNAGAADVSFVGESVTYALDGLGLMGEGGHTVDEIADLDTLPSQTKRAALTLYRLSQGALP